jgi:hypothetical protein
LGTHVTLAVGQGHLPQYGRWRGKVGGAWSRVAAGGKIPVDDFDTRL